MEANMALNYRSATRNLPDGYTFRGATLHDVPVVVYLFNQRQMTHSVPTQVEKVRQEWLTFNFNPAMDVRLIFDQREHLIGYIEVWTMQLASMQPWLWGCVHPDYEGRGIGTALLSWAEARVCLAMEMLPVDKRVAPCFGALHSLATVQALCEALGWQRTDQERAPVGPFKNKAGTLRLFDESSAYDVYQKEP
jgi:GNAT superfamily N-acetyltransferase